MLSLVAIPVVLVLSAALQFSQGHRSRSSAWLLVCGVGATLLFVLIGLPAAVAGNGVQLTLADPVPGVAISFLATASGYSILGLSLCAALVVLVRQDSPDSQATLMLSLIGVAVACLSGSLFTLACGAEIVAFSALFGFKAQDSSPRYRAWLELGVIQTAAACLIGSACWYQIQASTTSFNVLPASAATVASAPWGLGIVLLAIACAMTGSAKSKGLPYTVVAMGSLIVLNVVRLDQVATNGLNSASVEPLIAGGCLLAAVVLIRIWRAPTLISCAHWFWMGGLVPLLFVAAVQDPSGSALGTQTVALFVSGVLLALIATPSTLGISKSLGLLAVVGLPFGAVLPGWISTVSVLANASSAHALAWFLIVFAALYAAAGLRMAIRSREPGLVWRSRNIGLLLVGAVCVLCSLFPGLLAGSIYAWIFDAPAASTTAFTLPLAAGGSWPSGLVAAGCLAAAIVVFSSATILGKSIRDTSTSAVAEEVQATPARWRRTNAVVNKLGRAINNVDDWLAVEPRLVTVVLAGAAALAVFR